MELLLMAAVAMTPAEILIQCREVRDEIIMAGDHELAHVIYLRCIKRTEK